MHSESQSVASSVLEISLHYVQLRKIGVQLQGRVRVRVRLSYVLASLQLNLSLVQYMRIYLIKVY